MSQKTAFSIIIPNLNGADHLSSCLKSIDNAIKNTPKIKFEVILVDNGSTDGSPDLFQSDLAHPDSAIILNQTNLGFAQAVNQGIAKAKYPYVCLLNNDLVLAPDWFKIIHKAILSQPKNTAAFCGTVFARDGIFIESQGLKFFPSGKCTQRHHHQTYHPRQPFFPWGSSAAAVVYRKSVLKKIGLFDPIFFAYIEDVDLSYRLNHLNYRTLCLPSAFSYHYGGATSQNLGNFRAFYTTRNWYFFILKNYSFTQIIKNFFSITNQRLRNYRWLLSSTKFFFWLPHTLSIFFQVIFRLPYLRKQKRLLDRLLSSSSII